MNIPKEATAAVSRLIAKEPFFARILLEQMSVAYEADAKACATDGARIVINSWFAGLHITEQVFVLAHEILHAVFDHCPRAARYARTGVGPDLLPFNRKRGNQAMDYVVNAILSRDKIGRLPSGALFRGLSDADALWDDLYVELGDEGEDEQDNDSDGDDGDDGSSGGFDDHLPPSPCTEEEANAKSEQMRQTVVRATNQARDMGKMPGGLDRVIGGLIQPKQPWQALLRAYVEERVGKDERTWNRLNRRKLVVPPHVPSPGWQGYGLEQVVVCIDVSGSISDEEMTLFVSETVSLMTEVNVKELYVVWWDTEAVIRQVDVHDPEDFVRQSVDGGGGTVYDCALDKIDACGLEPSLVICFTDGWINCRREGVSYPHLTLTTGRPLPFGGNITVE